LNHAEHYQKYKAYQAAYSKANSAKRMETNRRWNAAHGGRKYKPEQVRKWQLKHHYGITPEDFDRMLAKQGGLCAICRGPFTRRGPHIDHDHKTNKIRGLLCQGCNQGIGLLKDDSAILKAAIDYLERNSMERCLEAK